MYPEVFGFSVYPIFVAASAILGCAVAVRCVPSGVDRWHFMILTVTLALSMLVGAKGYYLLEQWWSGSRGVVSFVGGFRQPGVFLALVVAPIAAHAFTPRMPLGRLLDAYVLPVGAGLAIFRVGCFLRGCCFGTVTYLPWAIRFPEGSPVWSYQEAQRLLMGYEPYSLPVHPLQAYLGLWALCSAVLAILVSRGRLRFPGGTFLWLVSLNEAGKALLENLRPPLRVGVDTAQPFHWIAAAMAVCCLCMGTIRHRTRRDAPSEERTVDPPLMIYGHPSRTSDAAVPSSGSMNSNP